MSKAKPCVREHAAADMCSMEQTSPWREFNEELVEAGVLSTENFRAPAFDYIGRRVEGIRWTPHFQCYEVLIAEVFALVPTLKQIEELKALRDRSDTPGVMWASPALFAPSDMTRSASDS